MFQAATIAALPEQVRILATCSVGTEHIDLAAAGLDVFRNEPEYDLCLQALPNVFLTPHMGSATVETRDAMGFRCLSNIEAVLNGRVAPDRLG